MLNKLYEIQEKVDFKNQVLAGLKIEQFLESVDDYESLSPSDKLVIFNLVKKGSKSSIKYVS
tara:strand:- start:6549 stop:6734 length:186 start_codon:yes stop_codon:yes gene_type:complete